MSPLRYGTTVRTPPNPCLECGVQCRRPKRFCSDSHRESWLSHKIGSLDARGISQIQEQRRKIGLTPEAMEFRRKLNVSRPF
jgi:hypothetical protein